MGKRLIIVIPVAILAITLASVLILPNIFEDQQSIESKGQRITDSLSGRHSLILTANAADKSKTELKKHSSVIIVINGIKAKNLYPE